MSTIAALLSPRTYLASLGSLVDAHTRISEVFDTNPSLNEYTEMKTRLVLAAVVPGQAALAGGRALPCDVDLPDLAGLRIAYLPSFQINFPDRIDTLLDDSRPFHRWLRQAADVGVQIGACGGGVFHLAAAGLLDGLPCAVPLRLEDAFRARFPSVKIERVVTQVATGTIHTCSRDIDCPAMVRRLVANAFSMTLAHSIETRDPTGDDEFSGHSLHDPLVIRAKLWIRDRFTGDFSIADLAEALGTSHHTLIRRFRGAGEQTPRNYAQQLRIEAACALLADTSHSISEVAQLVGYKSVPAFRQVFTADRGVAPGAFRMLHRGR